MEIHPLIDPYSIHYDSYAGGVYTIDTDSITLTAGTLTANAGSFGSLILADDPSVISSAYEIQLKPMGSTVDFIALKKFIGSFEPILELNCPTGEQSLFITGAAAGTPINFYLYSDASNIGGLIWSAADKLELYSSTGEITSTANITTTGTFDAGAITGTSFTDGTLTITGGNITGADVDISAGTGDYSSSGHIALGTSAKLLEGSVTGKLAFVSTGVEHLHLGANDNDGVMDISAGGVAKRLQFGISALNLCGSYDLVGRATTNNRGTAPSGTVTFRLEPDTGNITTTGRMLTGTGTEALPSLGFGGDLDTGIWLSAANQMSFSLGAVETFLLASTGFFCYAPFFNTYRYTAEPTIGPGFRFNKAKGTKASPLDVTVNHLLGDLMYKGYGGGAFREAAKIKAYADGDFSATSAPGRLEFYTTAVDAILGTLAMKIDSSQITHIGDGTNELQISNTGDAVFTGTAGLSFGSCYGNHIGWSQANAVQNTWYNISDADMADGNLNNVTHDGNGKLTVANAGMYFIGYGCCFEDNVANDHVEVGIEVSGSGSADGAGQGHLENKFANEEEHLSSAVTLDLAASATLEIAIRTTDAGTPTISVQAVNLSCVQIGGT